MRRFRFSVAIVLGLLVCCFAVEAEAGRFWCRRPYFAPTFAYGNVGYAAGYSTAVTRWGWGGWCGPRWGGWCTPRWNWCGPRWGWGCRPWGWGCAPWYGATTWGGYDSVYLSAPAGGGKRDCGVSGAADNLIHRQPLRGELFHRRRRLNRCKRCRLTESSAGVVQLARLRLAGVRHGADRVNRLLIVRSE